MAREEDEGRCGDLLPLNSQEPAGLTHTLRRFYGPHAELKRDMGRTEVILTRAERSGEKARSGRGVLREEAAVRRGAHFMLGHGMFRGWAYQTSHMLLGKSHTGMTSMQSNLAPAANLIQGHTP